MSEPAREACLALALIVFGGVLLIEVGNIPPSPFETFGAALVPKVSAILLVAVSLLVLARAALAWARAPRLPRPAGAAPADYRLAGTVAIVLAHAAAISFLGLSFIVATTPALFFMFLLLVDRITPRYLALGVALALTASIGLFAVFTRVFQIDLP